MLQHGDKHGFCGIRPLLNLMPASEISLQTEAGLSAMQDRQVHLQYLTEEHLGKFHDPNVTAKKIVSMVRKLRSFRSQSP